MSNDYGPYDRAGHGGTATTAEMESRFATYDMKMDSDPERTEAMKEHIRKLEQEKLELRGPDPGPAEEPKQKEGFMAKVADKFRDSSKDSTGDEPQRISSSNSAPAAEPDSEQKQLTSSGTDPNGSTLVVKERP